MNIRIKTAGSGDYDAIIGACAQEGWAAFVDGRDSYERALSASAAIVAYDGDTFLGYARAISDGHFLTFICEIIVAGPWRHMGVGRMLIDHIGDMYPHTRLELICDDDGFYARLGFAPIGRGLRRPAESPRRAGGIK